MRPGIMFCGDQEDYVLWRHHVLRPGRLCFVEAPCLRPGIMVYVLWRAMFWGDPRSFGPGEMVTSGLRRLDFDTAAVECTRCSPPRCLGPGGDGPGGATWNRHESRRALSLLICLLICRAALPAGPRLNKQGVGYRRPTPWRAGRPAARLDKQRYSCSG